MQVVLAGGTGLAKRGVTERFSEDIDITLIVSELSGYSNSQVRSWLRAMRLRAEALAIGAQMTHKGGSSYRSFVIPYRSGVGTTTSHARIHCDIKVADAEGRPADMIEVESLLHCGDDLRPGDITAAYEISNSSQKHRSGWEAPIPADGLKSGRTGGLERTPRGRRG